MKLFGLGRNNKSSARKKENGFKFNEKQGEHIHGGTSDSKYAEEDMKNTLDSISQNKESQGKLLDEEFTEEELDNVKNGRLSEDEQNSFRFNPDERRETPNIGRTGGMHR